MTDRPSVRLAPLPARPGRPRDARARGSPRCRAPHRSTTLLERALDAPIGRRRSPRRDRQQPRHGHRQRPDAHTSRAPRSSPRSRRHLPAGRWTLAVATGTHGAVRLRPPSASRRRLAEGASSITTATTDTVELGTTARGTPVRVHRCLVDADLVHRDRLHPAALLRRLRRGREGDVPRARRGDRDPHQPSPQDRSPVLAPESSTVIRAARTSRRPCAGSSDADVPAQRASRGPDDRIHAAVAGDVFAAFRAGADARAALVHRARAPAPLVIASDALPVTASLYQAAKIAAAAAPLVDRAGTLVVVAECRRRHRSARRRERGDLPDRRACRGSPPARGSCSSAASRRRPSRRRSSTHAPSVARVGRPNPGPRARRAAREPAHL